MTRLTPRDRFPIGSLVKDRETGILGVVTWHFTDKTIKDIVVVRWQGRIEAVAEPVESLRKYKPGRQS